MENNGTNNLINNNVNQQHMDQMETITNKEDLKDYIHEIHNFLRNSGIGYGMNALKIFNVFYGLYMISKNDLIFEKSGIPHEFRYDQIKLELEGIPEGEKGEYCLTRIRQYLMYIQKNPILKRILFYDIFQGEKIEGTAEKYLKLFYMIHEIGKVEESCDMHLSGKLYEYFIGRDKAAIQELGAYFTDRHIVDFIYENYVSPQLNEDGSIKSMIDPFAGSGGFTIGYIRHLQKMYPDIDWSSEASKIFHYDMNRDVVKSANLEFVNLTGVISEKNCQIANSFKSELGGLKYDYVITNPPYGGDKTVKTAKMKRMTETLKYIQNLKKDLEGSLNQEDLSVDEKANRLDDLNILNQQISEYKRTLKQLKDDKDSNKVRVPECSRRIREFAIQHNLVDVSDKEGSSAILMMDLLSENGICVAVIKEGFFFDQKYKNIREILIKNFNVTHVIGVPNDQFENTQTKTSILIFENTEKKTSMIHFSEIMVEKYKENRFIRNPENGWYEIVSCKGDIESIIENEILSVPLDSLIRNEYSLYVQKYNQRRIIPKDGYETRKMSDLITYFPKSVRPASFAKDVGIYPFYTSSDDIKRCDVKDYEEECIIVGTGGLPNIKMDKEFSCSADNFILKNKHEDIGNQYLLSSIHSTMDLFSKEYVGTTLKHISKKSLENFEIMIPTDPELFEFWNIQFQKYYQDWKNSEKEFKHLESNIQRKIMDISSSHSCNISKLSVICDLNYGKRFVKNESISGHYWVYGGGDRTQKTNIFNRSGFNILVGRVGLSKKCVRVKYESFYLNENGITIHMKTENEILKRYIGYYLLSKQEEIFVNTTGSVQRCLNVLHFKNMEIPIPSDEILYSLSDSFREIETKYHQMIQFETDYEALIQQFRDESIQEIMYGCFDETPIVVAPPEDDEESVVSSVEHKVLSETSSLQSSNKLKKSKDGSVCGFLQKNGENCKSFAKEGCNGRCGRHVGK